MRIARNEREDITPSQQLDPAQDIGRVRDSARVHRWIAAGSQLDISSEHLRGLSHDPNTDPAKHHRK
jgi:hypothetical protein